MTTARRSLLKGVASMGALSLSSLPFAQTTSPATTTPDRVFNPQSGKWRTFEVTTRVDILKTDGITRVWLPVPSINSDWQKSENSSFSSNGATRLRTDSLQSVQMLYAEFPASVEKPYVEITSREQTQNRSPSGNSPVTEDAATLKFFTRPTALLPTDGIVKATATKAIAGVNSDL